MKVKEAEKFVKNFKVQGVNMGADPDVMHQELYTLEQEIIRKIPFLHYQISEQYSNDLEKLDKLKLDKEKVKKKVSKESKLIKESRGEQEDLNRQKDVLKRCAKMEKSLDNDTTITHDDISDLYDDLKESFNLSDSDDESVEVDYDYQLDRIADVTANRSKYRSNINNKLNSLNIQEKICLTNLHFYEKQAYKLERKINLLDRKIEALKQSRFKGYSPDSVKSIEETIEIKGHKPMHFKPTENLPKVAEVKKPFKTNLVFADVTFFLRDKNNNIHEVPIPVSIPGIDVTNLSSFKPAVYMSVEVGGKYSPSNTFLNAQIQKRFDRGCKVLGITKAPAITSMAFSHSEQALFFALEKPEVRERIANLLKKAVQSKKVLQESGKNLTIESMALDIHSSRYMCDNCATSALGVQYDGSDLPEPSMKSLLVDEVRKKIPDISVNKNCVIHSRVGASIEFEGKAATAADHSSSVIMNSAGISVRDMRVDHTLPNSSTSSTLRSLNQHTLFTSGDTEEPKFKTAYAMAVRPLLEESANKIKSAVTAYMDKKRGKEEIPGGKQVDITGAKAHKGTVWKACGT